MHQPQPASDSSSARAINLMHLAQQAAVVCSITALWVLIVLGVLYAVDVLLMVFAALLFAIFLRSLSDPLSHRTRLGRKLSLAVVVLLLLALLGVSGWWLFPTLAEQVSELQQNLPASLRTLQGRLQEYSWGRWLVENVPSTSELLPQWRAILSRTTGIVSRAFGAVGVLLVVFFVGLMFAIQPRVYVEGTLQLVSPPRRPRAKEVLDRVGESLKWWLIAKITAMIIVGIMTWLGLWALGIDLAIALAVIAAVLTFIPNFGPIIAAVPAVLLGLMQSPTTAAWVVVLFIAIQLIESYGITPLIQYRALSLPPALTITAQLIMGAWVGGLGLALATPLVAALLVIVRMLYVQDMLGEPAGTEKPNDHS